MLVNKFGIKNYIVEASGYKFLGLIVKKNQEFGLSFSGIGGYLLG